MKKTIRKCGYCTTAEAVRAGTIYRYQKHGEIHTPSKDEAIVRLARLCRCPDAATGTIPGDNEVSEIRRPGQRILRKGTPVFVQLKRRPGTRRDKGLVAACFEDGTVSVAVGGATVRVPADEFVKGRRA